MPPPLPPRHEGNGRFAPSPTGALHAGNLRTALAAWLAARSQRGRFVVRMEDLDRVTSSRDHETQQLHDLAALGLDWDGPVVRQSERFDLYRDAIAQLRRLGCTYDCYCTRREIQHAAAAPHGSLPEGAYPGTCRQLSHSARRAHERAGRPAATRVRGGAVPVEFTDRFCGPAAALVDDFVLERNDGVPSYNVAVVVDDVAQGVGLVVRGDDLLLATPRQLFLAQLLGLAAPAYAHIPLVVGTDGHRLAKRHGAIAMADVPMTPAEFRGVLAESLGFARGDAGAPMAELAERFSLAQVPREPWCYPPARPPEPRPDRPPR